MPCPLLHFKAFASFNKCCTYICILFANRCLSTLSQHIIALRVFMRAEPDYQLISFLGISRNNIWIKIAHTESSNLRNMCIVEKCGQLVADGLKGHLTKLTNFLFFGAICLRWMRSGYIRVSRLYVLSMILQSKAYQFASNSGAQ